MVTYGKEILFLIIKNFIGFIDPGSFYGHNEMEVAYLRWFNPSFIDSNFLEKYNDYIKLEKNYLDYEIIYQLYYALCNVALWDRYYGQGGQGRPHEQRRGRCPA